MGNILFIRKTNPTIFFLNCVKKITHKNKSLILSELGFLSTYFIFKSVKIYIKKEIKSRYLQAERLILNIKYEESTDLEKECIIYNKNIINLQKYMEKELLANKYLNKLNISGNKCQNNNSELYNSLIDIYYSLFLSENLSCKIDLDKNMDNYKNLLNLLLNKRFNINDEKEELELIKIISRNILWIESHNNYISIILNIYQKMLGYEKKLFNIIEKMIKDREITLDEDNKIKYTIKSPFYFICEALLKFSIDVNLFTNLNGQKINEYIDSLKSITKDFLIIFEDLFIKSKEISIIQEFFEIEEKLKIVNKNTTENIINVLQILIKLSFMKKIDSNLKNIEEDLSNIIMQVFNFLHKNLGDSEDFRQLIINIFINEIKQVKNNNYFKVIIDFIIKNNLIDYSYQVMSIILSEYLYSKLSFIEEDIKKIQNDKNNCFELINNVNNNILNEILLTIFENRINIYFNTYSDYNKNNEDKRNQFFILLDKNFDIFKDCINLLEIIHNNKKEKIKEKIKNESICLLYCISYVKIYIFKLANFYYYNTKDFIHYKEIINFINSEVKTEVKQMIKIYMLKVVFYILGNYQDFINYIHQNKKELFFEEFKERFKEEKESLLSFYIIPNVDENKLIKFNEYFERLFSHIFSNFNKPVTDFVHLINNNGLDYFYAISVNLIFSNLASVKYESYQRIFKEYSSFVKKIFNDNEINLSEISKKLFSLYSDEEEFNKIIKNKIIEGNKRININLLEILLYSLRFCLKSVEHKQQKGFLFSEIMSPEFETILKENCIPGNNFIDDFYVYNYYLIEKHLIKDNLPWNIGAYVCSCGLYYSIAPCGIPYIEGKCTNCGKPIGGGKHPPGVKGSHGFAHVPGHYRIFKNVEQKNYTFSMYGDNDQSIPNMMIDDYKKLKIDPILNKEKYGIYKVSKFTFEANEIIYQKVRNLSSVGYRLLNFILYSHLFYVNCLGFISNEIVSKYVCDEMTCIQMIEEDWNFLKAALKSKGIQNIQIFLNLIFEKLSEKIKNCKEIKTVEEHEKFENEIEELLEQSYNEYDNNYQIYINNINKMQKSNKNSIKSLMLENNDIKAYDELDYPFYKYFIMTSYPTKEDFIHELKNIKEYEKKYPIISYYLREDNPEKFLIKYLPKFNNFSNFMIEHYSYKISREDAAKRIIKEEDLYKQDKQGFKKNFQCFIKIWEELRPYSIKYGCRDEMKPIDLNQDLAVAYFLNDDGDLGKGMYIASAYQNFIEWQNNFLDIIIENSKQNGNMNKYVRNMERYVDVQKAGNCEAINFDIVNKEFMKLIYENSKRNIFRKDTSINYKNYRQIIYDFDSIEKSLEDMLLPGKTKFQSHEKLKFITFHFEGFRGNKSSVLNDFEDKYKQVPLNLENKIIIYDIIKEEKMQNLLDILFFLQFLIFFFTQEKHKEEDEIKSIILPENITLSKECEEFLHNPKIQIKLKDLIGVYSFFELFCFESIIENLPVHYKKEMDNIKKNKIISLFEEKIFKIISKKPLAIACRKFISRYLVGNRKDSDYNENKNIADYLTRDEFWPKEIINNEIDFSNDIDIIKKENLIIGQCFELYKLLGIDERQEFEDFNKKN